MMDPEGEPAEPVAQSATQSAAEPAAQLAPQPAPPAKSPWPAPASDSPLPIHLKDAVGRKFTFPFDLVKTWRVRSLATDAIMRSSKLTPSPRLP